MPALSLRDRGLAPVAAVTFVAAGAFLAWALFFGGGDSDNRLAWIGGAAIVFASLLIAAALAGRVARPRLVPWAAWCIACLAALVVWQGASIVWSVLPDRSWNYLNRGLVYLAFLVLGLFVAALVPRATRATAGGLALLLGLVIAYALLAKGIPSLYPDYGRLARLRSPVGFWNALALLGDFALVLGLWRAAERRFDGALLVFGGALTVLLAYSRGGIVIGVVAAGLWLWLDSRRLEALAALVLGGAAAGAVFGVSLALNGISDDGEPRSVRAHDGWIFLLLVLVVAVLVAVIARRLARIESPPETRRRVTRALLAVVVVGCAAGVVVAALQSSGATSASAAGSHCSQGASRFGCGSSDERLDWWGQAVAMFERRPIGGTGAGSFELAHRLRRAEFVRADDRAARLRAADARRDGHRRLPPLRGSGRVGGTRGSPPARRRCRARARALPGRVSREFADRHRVGLRRRCRARLPVARRAARGAGRPGRPSRAVSRGRRARARRDGRPLARRAVRLAAESRRSGGERRPAARRAEPIRGTRSRSTRC